MSKQGIDIAEVLNAHKQMLQCSGGAMHVYRGAKLYEVGGVLMCSWCIGDVQDALRDNAEWVDRIVAEDKADDGFEAFEVGL